MNRQEHLLWILAEECGEVAQRASKAARFGMLEVQEGQKLNNAERILEEHADMLGAMEMLIEEGYIKMPDMSARMNAMIKAKKEKIKKYLAYSASVGTFVSQENCAECVNGFICSDHEVPL